MSAILKIVASYTWIGAGALIIAICITFLSNILYTSRAKINKTIWVILVVVGQLLLTVAFYIWTSNMAQKITQKYVGLKGIITWLLFFLWVLALIWMLRFVIAQSMKVLLQYLVMCWTIIAICILQSIFYYTSKGVAKKDRETIGSAVVSAISFQTREEEMMAAEDPDYERQQIIKIHEQDRERQKVDWLVWVVPENAMKISMRSVLVPIASKQFGSTKNLELKLKEEYFRGQISARSQTLRHVFGIYPKDTTIKFILPDGTREESLAKFDDKKYMSEHFEEDQTFYVKISGLTAPVLTDRAKLSQYPQYETQPEPHSQSSCEIFLYANNPNLYSNRTCIIASLKQPIADVMKSKVYPVLKEKIQVPIKDDWEFTILKWNSFNNTTSSKFPHKETRSIKDLYPDYGTPLHIIWDVSIGEEEPIVMTDKISENA